MTPIIRQSTTEMIVLIHIQLVNRVDEFLMRHRAQVQAYQRRMQSLLRRWRLTMTDKAAGNHWHHRQ